MPYAASRLTLSFPRFLALVVTFGLLFMTAACDSAAPTDPTDPPPVTPPPVDPPPVDPPPVDPPPVDPPEEEEVAVGAAYPNAADGRVILVNADGDRFVLWNPSNGSFSNARNVSTLENGDLPYGEIGAAVSTTGNSETYFFDTRGENYAVYERDESEFDESEEFGEDDTDFVDADIEEVRAAFAIGAQFFLFDQQGTRYQAYNYEQESWSSLFSFLTDFGGGGTPIASVGAAVNVGGLVYLFNRDGTEYTIYNDANRSFSDDFDIDELGDGTLSFE
ncbi:MAG: hypothetical protein AAFY55_17370 [Bacteroidota bacterium]